MRSISKTEWNMTHPDTKKFENGVHYISVYNPKTRESIWIPVKIKGVKKGERY